MVKIVRKAADRMLERLVPKATASAATYYVFCYCDGPEGLYKNCSATGSWCTECIYIGHYCV